MTPARKVEAVKVVSRTQTSTGDDVRIYKPIKVTMNFSQRDIDNTNVLMNTFRARSKAATVSLALGLTKKIAGFVEKGDSVFVRTKNGEIKEIVFPGLE